MKKLLPLIVPLWLFFTVSDVYAQEKTTLNFELPENFMLRYISPLRGMDDLSKFKGILRDTLESDIFVLNFQRCQSDYTNLLKGYYSKDYFNKIVDIHKLDTINVYQEKDIVNSLPVFSTILPNNRKVIIPDLNGNNDFSDDRKYEFTITNFDQEFSMDSLETLEFNYDYYHQGQLYKRSLKFKLAPTDKAYSFKDPRMKRLTVYFKMDGRREAKAKVEGREYLFTIKNGIDADYTRGDLYIKDLSNNTILRFNPPLQVGNAFSLGDKRVKIDQVSYFGETGVLTVLEPGEDNFGVRQEETLPDSSLNAFQVKLAKSSEYTLIDFWGSWCGPCIQALPDLKTVYEKYRNDPKFQLVSVAYENSKDLTKLNALVEKHGIDWQNIIEYQSKQGEAPNYDKMVWHFDVSVFPTTILLDKTGKIVYRDSGSDSFERLNAALAMALGY
ncbi:TlpA family protein disulfide reductase [Persicitalea sp.]|uniref:TlpA family protein disulfide reductase n=1 Tax=Persicitalea sp. TaxID=3100273 RepID=UPI003592FF56